MGITTEDGVVVGGLVRVTSNSTSPVGSELRLVTPPKVVVGTWDGKLDGIMLGGDKVMSSSSTVGCGLGLSNVVEVMVGSRLVSVVGLEEEDEEEDGRKDGLVMVGVLIDGLGLVLVVVVGLVVLMGVEDGDSVVLIVGELLGFSFVSLVAEHCLSAAFSSPAS